MLGVTIWTRSLHFESEHMNRIEAFEMWSYGRMLRIPWTAKKKIKCGSTYKNREGTRTAEYNQNTENIIPRSSDTKSKILITTNHNQGKTGRKMKNWSEISLLVEKY